MRYDMHPLLLSLPVMDNEEQMLFYLPHLQLGFYYDVHSYDPYDVQRVYALCGKPICACSCVVYRVGDKCYKTSGALLR